MYSNQSFGGANRGPGSGRQPRRRSNIFVDLGFFVLVIACSAAVGYQYLPLLTTSGYNVASGHIDGIGYAWGNRSYGHGSYGYSSRRSRHFDFLQADFSFTTGGKTYSSSVTSVPILTVASLPVLTLQSDTNKSGLAVRYDPADPQKCVPVEVIDCFTKIALVSYGCLFAGGMLVLVFAGLSNLSGEKWRPGQRTDAY